MTTSLRTVQLERDGPQTVVATLNRPEKRNALNIDILDQLIAAISYAEGNPVYRVLIVKGAGPVFSSGLDLAEASHAEHTAASAERIFRVLQRLSESRLITIALVHGAALAGGAGLMSACDFAIAAEGTKIGYPEPRRGLVPALVMTFLRRQIRERDARELLLSGDSIDASRAKDLGLINRVVPADQLMPEARAIVASVMQNGPNAIVATKKLLAELWPRPVQLDLERSLNYHLAQRNTPEAQEGINAYQSKRLPNWVK